MGAGTHTRIGTSGHTGHTAQPTKDIKILQPFLTGLIVAHAAFPAVFVNYPERQQDDIAGYIALSDCNEIGRRYVLVRAGQPDALVAVADCAQAEHVAYRNEQRLIADVDVMLWRGGYWPQPAEIWRINDRARWLERLERATNEH